MHYPDFTLRAVPESKEIDQVSKRRRFDHRYAFNKAGRPKHYLLKDKKLADLYLSEAERHVAQREYKTASRYIITGLKLFPDDTRLQSLNKQINAQYLN